MAGNKKHFYYYDLAQLKAHKVSNLIAAGIPQFGRGLTVSPSHNLFAVLDKAGYAPPPID